MEFQNKTLLNILMLLCVNNTQLIKNILMNTFIKDWTVLILQLIIEWCYYNSDRIKLIIFKFRQCLVVVINSKFMTGTTTSSGSASANGQFAGGSNKSLSPPSASSSASQDYEACEEDEIDDIDNYEYDNDTVDIDNDNNYYDTDYDDNQSQGSLENNSCGKLGKESFLWIT